MCGRVVHKFVINLLTIGEFYLGIFIREKNFLMLKLNIYL